MIDLDRLNPADLLLEAGEGCCPEHPELSVRPQTIGIAQLKIPGSHLDQTSRTEHEGTAVVALGKAGEAVMVK